jgi:hypothetical protein
MMSVWGIKTRDDAVVVSDTDNIIFFVALLDKRQRKQGSLYGLWIFI